MSGRRIDLSATQVIASMMAAVTGAVAASYLGVAGTVVGTAVMSVASTAVATIYKHYIGRSRERLRAAREAAARSAPLLANHRADRPGHDLSHAATRTDLSRGERGAYRATRPARSAGPDAEETQVLPAIASGPHRWDAADRANGLADAATQIAGRPDHDGLGAPANGATQFIPRPDLGDGDDGGSDAGDGRGADPGDAGPDARRDARWRRPRPLVLAGIALGVFLLAMAGITAFEALVGKPLDAVVGTGHGSGTTIGSIVGGSGGQTAPRHTRPAHPSGSPSPTPAASTSPAPTPTPAPTPSASPTPSSVPSPAPSESPGTSPGASPGAAQTGSPLAHGAHPSRSPTGG